VLWLGAKDPVGIKALLEQLALRLGLDNPLQTARLFSSWEAIVGPEVAAKCTPTSLKDGLLKVKTSSPGWASEFRYLAPEVIKRVNHELGAPIVKQVKAWVQTAGQKG